MTATALPGIRLPGAEGYTVADLHALPEDGRRWELIDGSLIVSPSATSAHNIIARWIAQILEDACPHSDVFVSTDQPMTIDEHDEPRPDILVASSEYLYKTPLPVSGVSLVAEVVSPTSVLQDTETKRALYARAGVPAYWIVVADRAEDEIRLAELILNEQTGRYDYATHYTTGVFETKVPWPVRIDLPALAAKRGAFTSQ